MTHLHKFVLKIQFLSTNSTKHITEVPLSTLKSTGISSASHL